jgi:putative transposase
MSDKYKGKYRNESARLQNWDYGSNAAYFITICTNDREHFFGEINNNKMWISPAGAIAYVLWFEIKNHVKNIDLGEFIVMPNHIHGILILNGDNNTPNVVGTTHALSLPQPQPSPGQQRFQNQGKNTISSIVGSYKSAVTKYCNRLELPFAWQSRFHDHIIRNDESFRRISEYIKNNPSNWKEDNFFDRDNA